MADRSGTARRNGLIAAAPELRINFVNARQKRNARKPFLCRTIKLESKSMTRRTLLSFATALAPMPQLLAAASIYDYDLETIDYRKLRLSDFKGKVLMIVNVASRCGYTPQYAGLQQLYLTLQGSGLRHRRHSL